MRTTTLTAVALAVLAAFAVPVLAAPSPSAGEQPYAGLEQRPIKALSKAAIDDYLAGRGMSFALAAELNGYPGPRHVLDHATALALTGSQLRETEALFRTMQADAVPLGRRIVEAEQALDRLFADEAAEAAAIADVTGRIGVLTGELRAVHLRTHVTMRALLTETQVAEYNRLRGYAGPADAPGGHGGHGGGGHL